MKLNRSLHIFLYLIACIPAFPQTYNFESISLENGLPQAQVTCIKEDTRGYLWIGTQGGGVACYDGMKFKVYDEATGIAGNIITAIEEDLNGHMWIGTTYGGVTHYDGKNFYNISKENGLLENNITSITVDRNNKIFVGTSEGLNTIENKIVSTVKPDIFLHQKTIKKVLKDSQGKLWFLAGNEVYLYNYYEWININSLFKIKQAINAVTEDKSGNIWLSIEGEGLYILSKKNNDSYQMLPYEKNKDLKNIDIQNVIFDRHNNIWLCTNDSGIAKFNGTNLQFFNKTNGFKASSVTSVCEDRSGNLWFGTNGEGIIKYNPAPFIYYDNIPGFDASNIFGIMSDKEDNLWIAPNGNEVIKYDKKTIRRFNSKNGLPIKGARVIVQDKKGTVWVGGSNGLFSIKNDQVKKFKLPDSTSVRSILFDNNGNMWIGSNGQGLYFFQDNNIIHYTKESGLTHNYVHTIYQDSRGIIWIGTGFGLNFIEKGKIGNYRNVKEFCNDYIGSITEDKKGNMYFGTDRCVVQFRRSGFKSFNRADGLASSTIYSLITDNLGCVWVGTNRGIDKLNISSKGEVVRIKNYSYQEGFKGIECNTRAVTKDKEGNLYYATIKGIIEYQPGNDLSIETKPTMHITGMDVFSKPFNFEKNGYTTTGWFHLPEEPTLSYNQNYVTIKFVGIDMYAPQKIKYQYMLEGLNKQWIKTTEPQVTYTNLKPGSYTFRVKAYTDSPFNYSITQYAFKISTPIWQTVWFYFLLIVLLLVFIYWLVQYRTKITELKNKKLEHYVAIRTDEIFKQKQEIEYLFKEVHHRVKNNLQVINSLLNLQKYYIEDNKMLEIFKDCQNRIYTMSVIHEKLYENNALSSINFNDYIKNLIEQLVATYQLDFPVKYRIEVDVDKMDLDTMIPIGLLINEIISNSLKYAFSSVKDDNIITFKMNKHLNESYAIIIGDNGKGSTITLNEKHATFGLELIKTLVEQLHGTIKKLPVKGTMYEIIFSPVS